MEQLIALRFSLTVCDCEVFSNVFSPSVTRSTLPVFDSDQYSPLSSSLSLRLHARTCVHHRHILATCCLITRARLTLRTSLAEQMQAKHSSVCYATKANHTTRTVQLGEREELSNRGTFYIQQRKSRQIKTPNMRWKNFYPRQEEREEESPNIRISVNFTRKKFHATL